MRSGVHRWRCLHVSSAVAVSFLLASGCSLLGPDEPWSGNRGALAGSVYSTQGVSLAGIEMHVCAEIGYSSTRDVDYQIATGDDGTYELSDMDLGGSHAFTAEYQVYVNRTEADTTAISSDHGTGVGTVTIEKDRTAAFDAVLKYRGAGPMEPEQLVE